MTMTKRLYLVAGLVAILAIAVSAVTLASGLTAAQSPDSTPGSVACDGADEADDAAETGADEADTGGIDDECGEQGEADDSAEATASDTGTDTVVPCSDPTGTDNDAEELDAGSDTDNIEEQCGPQDEAGDAAQP